MIRLICFTVCFLLSCVALSEPYKRSLYKHWIDADRDCQNTRNEVLIAESIVPPTLDEKGCRVIKGLWYDPFTGQTFTNPRRLDIDHFIPLREVHLSGGDKWTKEQRTAYANDLDYPYTLIAVSLSANRSKGARDPANWMPKNEEYECEYIITWVALKKRLGLSFDDAERQKIDSVLSKCNR
jgi:hypothetical protein